MQEMPDDEQQDEYFVSRLRQAGTHIMGRVTYDRMAEFWPKFDNPVASAMNDIPKVVRWNHGTVRAEDLIGVLDSEYGLSAAGDPVLL